MFASLVYVPVISGIIIIALITAFRRRSKEVMAFSIFSFALALWLVPQYISQLPYATSTPGVALFLIRASSALSNLLVVTFLVFVFAYIHKLTPFLKKVLLPYVGIPVMLFLLNFTDLMVRQVRTSPTGIIIEDAGALYFLEVVFVLVSFLAGIYVFVRSTLSLPPYLRTSNYLLMFGIAQGVIILGFGSIIFATSDVAQTLGTFSMLLMEIVVGFAIIKHRLFDIRLIVMRSMGYAAAIGLLAMIYGFVIFGFFQLALGLHFSLTIEIVLSLATGLSGLVFPHLKKRLDRLTNHLFFRDAYDPQELISQLNRTFVSGLDLEDLLRRSGTIITSYLKASSCAFVILEKDNSHKHIVSTGTFGLAKSDLEQIKRYLMQFLENVILAETISADRAFRTHLAKNDVEMIVRMTPNGGAADGMVGFFILGAKKSGNPYGNHDRAMLETLANELTIATQNALRFEEIENFNTTLQKTVKEKTRRLQQTNDKLRRLDQTKDDFISMASHQLRTPLTSIKGYISMVLEGDAGEVTPLQKKLLSQAFVSSQRMVYLISDLLNVSRLRTGRFVIERTPTNLATIAREEVRQLQETARSRGIELTVKHSEHFPALMLDETKMHQVIMNFIDNAIYYTQDGGHITVETLDKPAAVELTVTDDGLGVPKHDQPHLFTKFFRADNAKRARPDGTGLGLFMAKKVIVAQGGAIIFRSQEGKGSTFGFTFAKEGLLAVENDKPAEKTAKSLLHKPTSTIMS